MNNRDLSEEKRIWLWALYDFAGSLASINVAFYFVLWLVSDHNISSIWVSGSVALATVALLFTLPVFGAASDHLGKRMPFLMTFGLLSIICLFSLGVVAIKNPTLTFSTLTLVIILYFLYQYFYQASLAFFSSLMHDLAVHRTKEQLSGIGMAAGQLGNIVGLLLVFPIAQANSSLFGASGHSATFLAAALLFFIFSLPVLFFLKDKVLISSQEKGVAIKNIFKDTFQDLRRIRRYPNILAYLVTYYLFADAIIAFASFGEVISYRFAMLSLAVLVAISFFVFRFVREPNNPYN